MQHLDPSGSLTETFGAGELIEPADIEIDKANGTVYVTDGTYEPATPDIHIYKAFTVPNSITEPFSATSQTSGLLNGEVDLAAAGEEVTNCEFEYTSRSPLHRQRIRRSDEGPVRRGARPSPRTNRSAPQSPG